MIKNDNPPIQSCRMNISGNLKIQISIKLLDQNQYEDQSEFVIIQIGIISFITLSCMQIIICRQKFKIYNLFYLIGDNKFTAHFEVIPGQQAEKKSIGIFVKHCFQLEESLIFQVSKNNHQNHIPMLLNISSFQIMFKC